MSFVPISVVDAFVGALGERELLGNPAAVVLLEAPRDPPWMQRVALEMNLSETAFLLRRDARNFDLRWFTPTEEVELCGHATLAASRVLWECNWLQSGEIAHFHTLSGVLTARIETAPGRETKRENLDGQWIELDFPAQPVAAREMPAALRDSLGFSAEFSAQAFRAGDDWLVAVQTDEISRLKPNFAALGAWCHQDNARGVIVTARGEGEIDFVSRFFGPAVGVDEDPVTGSAHTKLAPFWAQQLGKREMLGLQDSARGGLVRVKCQENRVVLGGQTRLVLRGELFI